MLLKHKHVNRSGVVNFKDDIGESEIRESVFQRRGTPHPKSRNRSGISRRHSIDGRFIRHVEDVFVFFKIFFFVFFFFLS